MESANTGQALATAKPRGRPDVSTLVIPEPSRLQRRTAPLASE